MNISNDRTPIADEPGEPALPASAREAFAGQGLPWPPVPEALAAALKPAHEISDWVFATRPLPIGPYALEAYVDEATGSKRPDDYALVGFDGHGMNSWAAHVYLHQGPVALFLQLPWGGAFSDAEADRSEIERVFDWAGRLLQQVATLQTAGRWPQDRRLVVVNSTFGRSRWAWAPATPTAGPVPWQQGPGLETGIERALKAL